jgi:hypothetical protein
MPTKTTQPKNKKSIAEARAKLAEGAKAIKASNGAKPAKARVVNDTKGDIPEIKECKADIALVMEKRVKIDKAHWSLDLDEGTTTGEYLKIFDSIIGYSEGFQFLVGDLILKGEKLACFGGESKYRDVMLSTGRSLDSLKAYRSVAFHTPPEMRLLPYTHIRETVKIENLEDRKAIIEKFAKLADEGKKPSVQEVRAAADKLAPRKPKGKGKKPIVTIAPVRDATEAEEAVLKELEEEASHLASHVELSDFVFALKDAQVKKLRELLGRIAASHLRLTT